MARLAAGGATHLYVDGGKTSQRFLQAGVMTALTITTMPILIGDGLPLFGPVPSDIILTHIETRQVPHSSLQVEAYHTTHPRRLIQ
jgi:dihydrofolate reductase